tara:strand:- start:77 stop:337 length:261 start_codon:yes stop_codon:yes gene_type:complete
LLDRWGDGAFDRGPAASVAVDVLEENGALMAIRIKTRGNESAEQMMRRFKKLCEKEGLVKDVKRKEYYEKPSERKRRASKRGPIRD